jgi:hypothetical protein
MVASMLVEKKEIKVVGYFAKMPGEIPSPFDLSPKHFISCHVLSYLLVVYAI